MKKEDIIMNTVDLHVASLYMFTTELQIIYNAITVNLFKISHFLSLHLIPQRREA